MKAGTEDTSGKGQIISNINACQAVVDVLKTTLGKYLQHARLQFWPVNLNPAVKSGGVVVLTRFLVLALTQIY